MVENLYIGKNPKNAVELIKKFNTNPDSSSGLLTQPKVIGAGESVTVPSGRVTVLPGVKVDGEIVVEAGGEVFIPSGSSVDFSTGIKVNGEKLTMSIPTAYHIYNGSVEATNTILTNGFSTTLYTGNGTTQDVVTGVDMTTQWGDDASETYGGLVWIKSRTGATKSHNLYDTVRGGLKSVFSDLTNAESTIANSLTNFNNTGFAVGSYAGINANTESLVSWNFQTTHRTSGVTNHGKPYECHYNPYTGFTIVKYEGSGLTGHEIPHHLGRKLGFVAVKRLDSAINWVSTHRENYCTYLNLTNAEISAIADVTNLNNDVTILGSSSAVNGTSCIMYGWANSYFDEASKLIGNYEIGVYQGTGVAGNKVTTRGKPAWVMIKRLDAAGNWCIGDNTRGNLTSLYPNLSSAEFTATTQEGIIIYNDGFTPNIADSDDNASGGQYLYMVVYDNDSGSGKSKYPKATDTTNLSINALVPYANGIDVNGSKVSIEYKNETITGLTLTQGKNYVYSKNDGTYGVSSIAPSYGKDNPLTGDFFNLNTLKWYDSSNAEITPRTYLDCIVHADHNGQISYVEELSKTTYFDEVKANEFKGKNTCTAWVVFDGTTTPVTIIDSYNVSKVIRTSTGIFQIYPIVEFNNNRYSICGSANGGYYIDSGTDAYTPQLSNKVTIRCIVGANTFANQENTSVQIFGGTE